RAAERFAAQFAPRVLRRSRYGTDHVPAPQAALCHSFRPARQQSCDRHGRAGRHPARLYRARTLLTLLSFPVRGISVANAWRASTRRARADRSTPPSRSCPQPAAGLRIHAADTARPRCVSSSLRISVVDIAGLNRNPCISVQPSVYSMFLCCSVSTPSAVVVMLLAAAIFTTASTIDDEAPSPSRFLIKERSILILSNGNRCR